MRLTGAMFIPMPRKTIFLVFAAAASAGCAASAGAPADAPSWHGKSMLAGWHAEAKAAKPAEPSKLDALIASLQAKQAQDAELGEKLNGAIEKLFVEAHTTRGMLAAMQKPTEPPKAAAPAKQSYLNDIAPDFTGGAILHANWCRFCPGFIAAVKAHDKDGWKVGPEDSAHFKLIDYDARGPHVPTLDFNAGEGLPCVCYFVNGKEDRSKRWSGPGTDAASINEVLRRNPRCSKPKKVAATEGYESGETVYLSEPMYFESPIYMAPSPCANGACGSGISTSYQLFGLPLFSTQHSHF